MAVGKALNCKGKGFHNNEVTGATKNTQESGSIRNAVGKRECKVMDMLCENSAVGNYVKLVDLG